MRIPLPRPLCVAGALAGALIVPASAGAQQTTTSAATAYRTPDGTTVQVSFSSSLTPDPAVAQSYVDFLGSLPHGSELSELTVHIVAPEEVVADCGGADGTLACYSSADHTMTVPAQAIDADATGTGVTTAYIIAHEYGHHIAAYRDNAPFESLAYGPKYWSSYEMVCNGALSGRYHPGDEGRFYTSNPGEAWADTYAHLVYPDVEWRYAASLKPTPGSLEAARRDVLTPWKGRKAKTFTGTFGPNSKNARHFTFKLTLDGRMTVTLRGPKDAELNLALVSGGKVEARSDDAGSRDVLDYEDGACRDRGTETVTLSVSRKSGTGPFSVRVAYAG